MTASKIQGTCGVRQKKGILLTALAAVTETLGSGMSWGIPPLPAVLSLWTISCFPALSAYRT